MSIDPRWRTMLALASLWAASCTKRNPDLCCENNAECTAIGFSSFEKCDLGVCVQNACTTTPNVCDDDLDCPDGVRHCVAGTCAACATSETCPTSAPVCDAAAHSCRACVKDSECDSRACDLAAGTCVDPSNVRYASPTGTERDACSLLNPCSLSKAGLQVDAAHPYLALLEGTYRDSLSIDGKNATVCGNGALIDVDQAGFYFRLNAMVEIRDLNFAHVEMLPTAGEGRVILCNECSLKLDNVNMDIDPTLDSIRGGPTISAFRSTFHNGGINVSSNSKPFIRVDQSIFTGNASIQLSLRSYAEITNSIFNTRDSDRAALEAGSSFDHDGYAEVQGNTFVDSRITCTGAPLYQNKFNSNILYRTGLVTNDDCIFNYNLIEPTLTVAGANNIAGDPLFVDLTHNNLRLQKSSPAIDHADPAILEGRDIDNVVRPQGAAADIGAYEYVP